MDREAVRVINDFVKKIKKKFSINKVIFFGSRANDEYLKSSDIDLVIVSDDFEGIDFSKRISMIYNYWDFKYAVDFLCYTKKEFEKFSKMITIAREALRKGIIIS